MDNTLKLVGRTGSEIFLLRFPSSVLDFCGFDLSYFAKNAVDICTDAQKTGVLDPEAVSMLKREIQSAHCYIAHNIRTIYDKVAIDCFIDHLCRRDNIGPSGLWNRYITCRTPFEKMVFSRLCEFRYNKAINEWQNIVRLQDYAKSKIDFIFTKNVKSAADAASRRNYFDLMFSVTAREMGCKIEDLGTVKVFSVGRVPSSPFMFPTISKDIVRHVLSEFDYSDDYSDVENYGEISDRIAMDAFSKMKAGLPSELSSYNIVRGKMENYVDKIYMPCSLKAVIDLEIDAIIDNGYLCACARCGRLYLRNEEYNEDYCRTYLQNGRTCLEIYREEHPAPKISEELEEKSRSVTDEVYSRVGTMNEKEYEYWYAYMSAMKEKVASGEITPEELDEFLSYSLNVDITRSKPIVEVPKAADRPSRERVVKPFIPQRISRDDIKPPAEKTKKEPEYDEELPAPSAPKDGFFVSPTVSRRKNESQQISHIIRGGEPRGEANYFQSAKNSGFAPFERQQSEEQQAVPQHIVEEQPREQVSAPKIVEFTQSNEPDTFTPFTHKAEGVFTEDYPTAAPKNAQMPEKPRYYEEELPEEAEDVAREFAAQTAHEMDEAEEISARETPREERPAPVIRAPEAEQPARPRVIKKNAAAISAYGKIAGAPVTTAPYDELPQRAQTPVFEEAVFAAADESYPDDEPFKDIGSIFDVLEQSENDMSGRARQRMFEEDEPQPEWSNGKKRAREAPVEQTGRVGRENAPSGIWTEERNLFKGSDAQSELDMLKEKKHAKSNKTQRLYDVIMREPDDNPNFRRKG